MICLLGGASVLRPSLVGVRSTLREASYPVVVSLVLCAIDLVADFGIISTYGDAYLSPTWLLNILEALFLCVFVGLFEEGLVRVLLFCGILSHGGRYGSDADAGGSRHERQLLLHELVVKREQCDGVRSSTSVTHPSGVRLLVF